MCSTQKNNAMVLSHIDVTKLETFVEINTLINSNYTDIKGLLTQILDSATKLTEGEASSLLLLNSQTGKLHFEIALGPKGSEVKKYILNPGEGIAGWVSLHNKSLIQNDVEKDPRYFSDISSAIDFRTRSMLAVPMRIKDKCVGVIEILNKKDNKLFTNEDLFWLDIFATQSAIALENARYYAKAQEEIHYLQDQIQTTKGFHPFVAKSKLILEKLDIIDRVAKTDSSVLILGESGVGKELIAEQIHLKSNRKDFPLIRVNCAALPEGLLESELFGHVKGAYTDAIQCRRGRFELANGGTIFLDEIGDLPLVLQAKLLRVIQQKSFEPVGASESISVDVRIVAATNKDIEQLVAKGEFRSDLYYRLNVLPMYIPPLRQRKEDILDLADFFLKKITRETNKKVQGFSDAAVEVLLSYDWPGNIRELENAVERAVVIGKTDFIQAADLLLFNNQLQQDNVYNGLSLKDAVNQFKRTFIQRTLVKNQWHQTETAKALDIQRTYLSRLIKELNVTSQKG
jgi:Nif-specific regulatory protein